MKSADQIIARARYRTKNASFTYDPTTGVYTSGVSTELFLDAINDAQDHLQAALISANTNLFRAVQETKLVAGQQWYPINDRVFGGINIISVHFNPNNNSTGYGSPLRKGEPRDSVGYCGSPAFYIPCDSGIFIYPVPSSSSGSLKIQYYKELDDLDIRRGLIISTPSGNEIELSTSPRSDDYQIENSEWICVCDRWGKVMLQNGLFAFYYPPLRTITLQADVSTFLLPGYSLEDLTEAYITCGKYTTTHSKLPDLCERYLRVYTQKRLMTSQDDNTSVEEDQELLKIEESILETYANEDRDIEGFPVIDEEIMR